MTVLFFFLVISLLTFESRETTNKPSFPFQLSNKRFVSTFCWLHREYNETVVVVGRLSVVVPLHCLDICRKSERSRSAFCKAHRSSRGELLCNNNKNNCGVCVCLPNWRCVFVCLHGVFVKNCLNPNTIQNLNLQCWKHTYTPRASCIRSKRIYINYRIWIFAVISKHSI